MKGRIVDGESQFAVFPVHLAACTGSAHGKPLVVTALFKPALHLVGGIDRKELKEGPVFFCLYHFMRADIIFPKGLQGIHIDFIALRNTHKG
jgi:hypothetical protein